MAALHFGWRHGNGAKVSSCSNTGRLAQKWKESPEKGASVQSHTRCVVGRSKLLDWTLTRRVGCRSRSVQLQSPAPDTAVGRGADVGHTNHRIIHTMKRPGPLGTLLALESYECGPSSHSHG